MSKSVCVVTAAAVSLIAFAPASAQPRPRYPTRLPAQIPAQIPAQTVAAPPAAAASAGPAAVET
ncbi:MAG: hypothetical protein M3M95_07625, partial [Pseudomonadota bacterium]|nr:hypothetical protein [Pseudomonadota bacterium]